MIIDLLLFGLVFIGFGILVLGLKLVSGNQVGIVTKNMFGQTLPQGQIVATKGEVGLQADILMPGLYWRMPIIYRVEKWDVTYVKAGEVGIVESVDGRPITAGRLLGDRVECNSFQDAKAFLDNGGCKGPQIDVLRPGTYRINRRVFQIKTSPAVSIPSENVGIAIAQDGISLPSEYIIAPAPLADCQHFQNGQAFIDNKGFRGPQLETLQPGIYYINPYLFKVEVFNVATVPPGYVAVIISSVGRELEKSQRAPPEISDNPSLSQPPIDSAETTLITDKTQRGILQDPVSPGKYNLNTIAYRTELVPTSAVTIDWASPGGVRETDSDKPSHKQPHIELPDSRKVVEFFTFNQLKVTAKDGFQLEVEVRLIIRIPPSNAPAVIARFGTVENLIQQVAHPLIDASFRNEAGKKQALEFVHSRTELQEQALEHAKNEFKKYHVEVQGLLIAYIDVDKSLLDTQTKKQIAVQQQEQYKQEASAQEQRIAVAEKTARADKQSAVIDAKLSIEIAGDRAQAAVKEAEGVRDATKTKADGSAYEAKRVGEGVAEAYTAQAKSIGAENMVFIKLLQEVSSGKIKITPDILVSGGADGNQGGLLFNAFMARLMKPTAAEALAKSPE